MIGARNVRGGIVLLSGGLVLGLVASLYAFVPMVPQVPAALDQYDDVARRLLRLAHIAALMLPLINIVLGGWLDRLTMPIARKVAVSHALLWGAVGVPLALAFEAAWAPAREWHLSGLPVLAFCGGVFASSAAAWHMGPDHWR
jgi:hypothetical protein